MSIPVFNFHQYGEGAKAAVPQYREDILNETDYITLWSKLKGPLETMRDEFAWKAITTDMNIDAEWDAYVKKWLGAGGQEILDELAKMPLTLPIRDGNIVY